MAKSATRTADRLAAGQHGADQAPTVEVNVRCDLGQCAQCPGTVLSLLVPVGTPCGCDCHGQGGRAA
jgi:hypothetical protein